jgi:hypothetical protein
MIEVVDDLVVHRATMLRMGVQHKRYRGIGFHIMVITALEATIRAIENYIRH